MPQRTDNEEAFINELLKHDRPSLVPFVFFYEICTRLRRDWPAFNLAHFNAITDDLNIDTGTILIRPDEVCISSCELGELAAGVWGEHPREWPSWKQRLIAEEDPSQDELALILEKICAMRFIKRAWWSDRLIKG